MSCSLFIDYIVCESACVRACVRVCVCVCERARLCVYMCMHLFYCFMPRIMHASEIIITSTYVDQLMRSCTDFTISLF